MTTPESDQSRPDFLTVIAIALTAYAASNFAHEAIGHGGACVILGGKPLVLSSVHFECGAEALSALAQRGVASAGTIMNFIAGALGLVAFKITDPLKKPRAAYFLWLFTTLNLLMGAGYFLFSGIGGIGDWAAVSKDTMSPLVWRPAMALFGGALYFLLARQSARWLGSIVGSDELSMKRGRALTIPPYFAGGLLFCVSGLFNPVGPILIAISAAAASFGGASGLLWLTRFLRRGGNATTPPARLNRSYGWIVGGSVVSLIFIFVLGRSVHFTAIR